MEEAQQELTRSHLSAAFPPIVMQEMQEMTEDIRQNGVREPIVVHEGEIIDGWHRYLACRSLDIECPYREYNQEIDGEIHAFAISQNKMRRHTTKRELALAVMRILEYDATAKRGRPANETRKLGMEDLEFQEDGTVTLKDVADAAGVSVKTAARAAEDLREEQSIPEPPAPVNEADAPPDDDDTPIGEEPPEDAPSPPPATKPKAAKTAKTAKTQGGSKATSDLKRELKEAKAGATSEMKARAIAEDLNKQTMTENERLNVELEAYRSASSPDEEQQVTGMEALRQQLSEGRTRLEEAQRRGRTLQSQVNEWQQKYETERRSNLALKKRIKELEQ